MTGGSRFALRQQLNIYKKSGFHSKLSTEPDSSWIITFIGKKTDTPPRGGVKESVVSEQESTESEENVDEEVEDFLDSNEISPYDYYQGNLHKFTSGFVIMSCLTIFHS